MSEPAPAHAPRWALSRQPGAQTPAAAGTAPRPALTGMQRPLVTPEGVELRLEIADASQRFGALALDLLFMILALIGLTLLTIGALTQTGWSGTYREDEIIFSIWLLGAFLLRSFWFTAFEMGPGAATPGKRILGLRVAMRDGSRLTPAAVFARNALRELELFMPLSVLTVVSAGEDGSALTSLLALGWVTLFALFPLFNRDRLRCGDLVAGTWVVRVPKRQLLHDLAAFGQERLRRIAFSDEQLSVYGIHELHILEDVLRASDATTLEAVRTRIAAKIGWREPVSDDEAFLQAYYTALRARLEGGLLLGKRRRDKHDKAA